MGGWVEKWRLKLTSAEAIILFKRRKEIPDSRWLLDALHILFCQTTDYVFRLGVDFLLLLSEKQQQQQEEQEPPEGGVLEGWNLTYEVISWATTFFAAAWQN